MALLVSMLIVVFALVFSLKKDVPYAPYKSYLEKQEKVFLDDKYSYEATMLGALAARDSRKALRSFLIAAGFKRHGPELVYLAAIYSGLYIIPSEPDEVRASLVDGDLAKKYYKVN
ncbi:hypothetical protein [Chitiniphilus eburneus]|uniref:hypothetical protein n=1 Tax=Chitiniphilus eburneus TaxID=2571148 RepID=UPI0035CEB91D